MPRTETPSFNTGTAKGEGFFYEGPFSKRERGFNPSPKRHSGCYYHKRSSTAKARYKKGLSRTTGGLGVGLRTSYL